jgi:hypothetical protein
MRARRLSTAARGLQESGGAARAGKAVAALSDSDDEESEGSPPDTRRAGSMGEPVMGGPLSGGLTIPTSSDDPGAPPLQRAAQAARSRMRLWGGILLSCCTCSALA